ncbi:MAG TPA: 3-oxoacyl-[acyl-carrier-protein] reductase [Candidatus Izemoplasmatales bacterium]|nr:3-oxoacyl-[acyl-carrier-protein] reductase [Candidatus Izemoplasmatales bacterium]
MENYHNKTILITGASRGIGRAIALAYAELGANVVVNYIRSKAKADTIVKEIKDSGGSGFALQADVSIFSEAKKLVEQAIKQFGKIDVLINNSGIKKDQLMLRMSEDDFDRVIQVNLKGTWNMCRQVTRHFLKNRSGSIINISSVVGLIGNPGQVNYVASKAGVIGMTKSLSKEFGSRNIRVNAIAPGFIQTDMTDQIPDGAKEAYLKQIPLKRLGEPKDIADLCTFLSSDKASYITGQVISVNGGMV